MIQQRPKYSVKQDSSAYTREKKKQKKNEVFDPYAKIIGKQD